MKKLFQLACAMAFLPLILCDCGKGIVNPSTNILFGPPQGLKALSVDSSTVQISWSAAPGSNDSSFWGYVIRWGTSEDSVSKNVLTVNIDSLPQAEILFTLYSRKTSGERSEPVTIRWAAAARFDSAYVLQECNLQNSTRAEGMNLGSQSTDPYTLGFDPSNPAVLQNLDLLLFGGRNQSQDPLALWSASSLSAGFSRQAKFSSVTSSSGSLDYPLGSFPDVSTFSKDSIAVNDNTIYYVRRTDGNGNVNYVRVHIHVMSSPNYPDRTVEVRISLQRVPSLIYAEAEPLRIERVPRMAAMLPLLK